MNIMKSLPNLKSLDSRKETQSNYNQYHQKINIQDDEKIQLHSQEAKQEQVTVPILKESEMVNYAQKQNVDNMSVASQDFKGSQRKRTQKENEKTYQKILQTTKSN